MEICERIAAEALALVGVPFRLHGRSAETGVDCVGLAALVALRAGVPVGPLPPYALRGFGLARVEQRLRAAGLESVDQAETGNLLVASSGPMQLHFMIMTMAGLVHAHAGLGRVVLMPQPSPWPLLGQWRFTAPNNRG